MKMAHITRYHDNQNIRIWRKGQSERIYKRVTDSSLNRLSQVIKSDDTKTSIVVHDDTMTLYRYESPDSTDVKKANNDIMRWIRNGHITPYGIAVKFKTRHITSRDKFIESVNLVGGDVWKDWDFYDQPWHGPYKHKCVMTYCVIAWVPDKYRWHNRMPVE